MQALHQRRLAAAAGRAGARKAPRKKPKLTVDDLRKPMGMVYVVTEFADEFRRVYKGPGHEARPLAFWNLYFAEQLVFTAAKPSDGALT